MKLDSSAVYELAVSIVTSEAKRDKLTQCRELIKQMIRSSDPATRAVAILASTTLDAVAKAISDDEG